MNKNLGRATLCRLEEGVSRLVDHIEDITARRELMSIAQEESAYFGCSGVLDSGLDFGLYFDDAVLCFGEREPDGFCSFEVYGPDGEHLFGYGGDGYDLAAEVRRCAGG